MLKREISAICNKDYFFPSKIFFLSKFGTCNERKKTESCTKSVNCHHKAGKIYI